MKQFATIKPAQIAAKYGEHAPMATACCNACRTCVTTNLLGIATAAFGGLALAVSSRLKRVAGR